ACSAPRGCTPTEDVGRRRRDSEMGKWLITVLVALAALVAFEAGAMAQERCPFTQTASTIGAGDPTQTGRFGNGLASTCAVPKTAPNVVSGNQTFRYHATTLQNRSTSAQCISITLATTAGSAASTAYLGSFVATNTQTNYLGDSGGTAPATYSVTVPALANFVVVVHETSNSGATYTLTIAN